MKLFIKYAISGSFIILAIVLGVLVLMEKIPGYWIFLSIILLGVNKTVLWSEMSLFAEKREKDPENLNRKVHSQEQGKNK